MFIRTTRNSGGQAYYHLVESYRAAGKVKQRTLLSLGRVESVEVHALIVHQGRFWKELMSSKRRSSRQEFGQA